MKRKKYRRCKVPKCENTSITTPNKLFIEVPRKKNIRKIWFELARCHGECVPKQFYFCEDHFDLPNDMKNYMQYHIQGFISRIMLRPGCLPSKFECQTYKKSRVLEINTSCTQLVQESLEEIKLKDSETELVNVENQLKKQNKHVQAFIQTKYIRSKCIQTSSKSKNIALSPFKTCTKTVNTSPLKKYENVARPSVSKINRNLMESSDSEIVLCTPSIESFEILSPSIQSLNFNLSFDSSSLNEEKSEIERKREAKKKQK